MRLRSLSKLLLELLFCGCYGSRTFRIQHAGDIHSDLKGMISKISEVGRMDLRNTICEV